MSDTPARGLGSSSTGPLVPVDLLLVVAVTLGALWVALTSAGASPLRIVLGLAFVFLAPGYALVAALFPAARGTTERRDYGVLPDRFGDRLADVGGPERFVLAVGLSVTSVPLVGLVLNFTPWGIRLESVLVALAGVTLALVVIAAVRRRRLPAGDQYHPAIRQTLGQGARWVTDTDSPAESALNVVLVLGLVLVTSGVVYAIAVPKTGESYTEFYLLTENETGALVADDYPTTLSRGEQAPMYVGITNREHRTVTYTVVVELQRVRTSGGNATVLEESELHQFETTLDHNESWRQRHVVQPTFAGESVRLTYLLYADTPPSNPSVDTAYRSLHVWLEVSPTGTQATVAGPTGSLAARDVITTTTGT